MFVERKVRYSALFTNLVGWHASAVSFPLSDIILALLPCPLSDVMFCFYSRITNLSLYKDWIAQGKYLKKISFNKTRVLVMGTNENGRQANKADSWAGQIDVPALTAIFLKWPLTELTFATKQTVCAINQSFNEMSVVLSNQ